MVEVQLQETKDQELAEEVQQTEEVHTVEIHEDRQEDKSLRNRSQFFNLFTLCHYLRKLLLALK